MKHSWENFPIKKRTFIVCALSLALCGTARALTIGPSETKKERERHSGSARVSSSGTYEAVMQSFLSGDFSRSEKLAERYRPGSSGDRSEEVAMIRALSLMKLGRFEEARTLLNKLQNNSSSPEVRAQAAYSFGDSYYFQNDRAQADIYYKQALERYPEHGEAGQVRRLLGLSHPVLTAQPLHQAGMEESVLYSVQIGSFSKRRNAERLLNKLMRNRLDAYILQDEVTQHFRVRVGHLTAREDAQSLESRLKKSGYPTKIFP